MEAAEPAVLVHRTRHDWVTVKHYWRLTVTSAEKAALTDMLEGCTWASKP